MTKADWYLFAIDNNIILPKDSFDTTLVNIALQYIPDTASCLQTTNWEMVSIDEKQLKGIGWSEIGKAYQWFITITTDSEQALMYTLHWSEKPHIRQ